MTDIYAKLVAGIEEMQLGIPPEAYGTLPRSVLNILNNPARLAYDFKVQQARDKVKFNLTLQIVEEILSERTY